MAEITERLMDKISSGSSRSELLREYSGSSIDRAMDICSSKDNRDRYKSLGCRGIYTNNKDDDEGSIRQRRRRRRSAAINYGVRKPNRLK